MKYDVDYFIEKFKKIPEENWIVRSYSDGEGNCCAIGHCGAEVGNTDQDEAQELRNLIGAVTTINDGDDLRYRQPTPKQRILAALQHIKKLHGEAIAEGDPREAHDTKGLYPDITKEVAVVEDRIETDFPVKQQTSLQ